MKEKKSVVVKPAILNNVKTAVTSSNVATVEKHVDQKETQQLKLADIAKSANMTKDVAKKEKVAEVKADSMVKEVAKKEVKKNIVEKKVTPKKAPVEKKAVKKPVEAKIAEPKKVAEVKKVETKKIVETKKVEEKKVDVVNTSMSQKDISKEIILQYGNIEVSTSDIYNKVVEAYIVNGNTEAMIKDLKIYIKPEENKAYYVINQEYSASVDLA